MLTIDDIRQAIYHSSKWSIVADSFIADVWDFFEEKVDLAIMDGGGCVTEIAIRRNFGEFMADFKKKAIPREDTRIYSFFFCVPTKLYPKVRDFLLERFKGNMEHCPGVLTFSENGKIERKGIGNGLITGKHRPLFLEERLELAKIGARHYWTARRQ